MLIWLVSLTDKKLKLIEGSVIVVSLWACQLQKSIATEHVLCMHESFM